MLKLANGSLSTPKPELISFCWSNADDQSTLKLLSVFEFGSGLELFTVGPGENGSNVSGGLIGFVCCILNISSLIAS